VSRAYLSRKLTRPLPTKDGGTLRTIREACDYMAAIGKERELRRHWQQVAKLILEEADVASVSPTRAIEGRQAGRCEDARMKIKREQQPRNVRR
jgi:hypothetical protein